MSCHCGDTCVMVPTCEEEADFDCQNGYHTFGPAEQDEDGRWWRCEWCGDVWEEDDFAEKHANGETK